MTGEVQHGNVTVGVAGGEDRPSPGATPNPNRFLRTIVEKVRLGLVRDRAAPVVIDVVERCRAADHALSSDPVDVLTDGADEVTTPTRGDVVGEAVVCQVVEQV